MKILSIYTGTDIVFTTPSHPVSAAIQAERMINKIAISNDDRFEVNTNSSIVIDIIETLSKRHDIKVIYFINGKKSSYHQVLKDLSRGEDYKSKILNEK